MHELSIAHSILETALREKNQRGIRTIKGIGVRIGVLSGVLPDALSFGFEVLTRDTPIDGCSLVIEHVPVEGNCHTCGTSFAVDNFLFRCPACDSGDIEVTRGFEMDIAYIEIGDEADTALSAG